MLQFDFVLKVCIKFETCQLIWNANELAGFHMKDIITLAGINYPFSSYIIVSENAIIKYSEFWKKVAAKIPQQSIGGSVFVSFQAEGEGSQLLVSQTFYLFKVSNRNIRKRCEICSKLTIKTREQYYWLHYFVFIVNFEYILHFFLVFLLLNLNR